MLDQITFSNEWLYFTGKKQPDINLKDTEILLRAFAMLVQGHQYREPMAGLINGFAKKAKTFNEQETSYARDLIREFLGKLSRLPRQNIAFF